MFRLPDTAKGIALALSLFVASAASAAQYRFGLARVTFDGHAVTFHNGLTSATDFPDDFSVELTNGITIQVVIMQNPSMQADVMAVIPPPGYIAVPAQVTVEEHAKGVIHVVPEGMS